MKASVRSFISFPGRALALLGAAVAAGAVSAATVPTLPKAISDGLGSMGFIRRLLGSLLGLLGG